MGDHMLSSIWYWFFPRATVNKIVGKFQSTVAKLESHANVSSDLATQHRVASVEHTAAAAEHDDEATRARVIAANLATLLHV
jgi:hypothetical protein